MFAVFKAKDPEVWVNGVKLADLNITYGTLVPHIRITLDLNITVHNPNKADFTYTNGTSMLYYQKIEVGHAVIPAGKLSSGDTVTQIVRLNVEADKFLMGSNFTTDFAAGACSCLLLHRFIEPKFDYIANVAIHRKIDYAFSYPSLHPHAVSDVNLE